MQEQIEAKALRKQIYKLFERIHGLGCDEAELAAGAVLPNHPPSTIQSFQRLKQIEVALEAVLADFSADADRVEMSHWWDISTLPNTNHDQIDKTGRTENRAAQRPIRTTPAQIWLLASERFREYLAFYAAGLGSGRTPG